MRSLPEGQHMARVTIPEDDWLAFRALAIQKKRSVTAYLGHLVQKEIGRAARVEIRRERRQEVAAVETADDEVDESWVPPWEI